MAPLSCQKLWRRLLQPRDFSRRILLGKPYSVVVAVTCNFFLAFYQHHSTQYPKLRRGNEKNLHHVMWETLFRGTLILILDSVNVHINLNSHPNSSDLSLVKVCKFKFTLHFRQKFLEMFVFMKLNYLQMNRRADWSWNTLNWSQLLNVRNVHIRFGDIYRTPGCVMIMIAFTLVLNE